MMRLAAAALVVVAAGFPLAVYPAAPVTWLALTALLAGGAGVALLSVPMVSAGGALALIAYAAALLIARPEIDSVSAIALGATLTLLLSIVHFAGRTAGAEVSGAVVAAQAREWIVAVAVGILAAVALPLAGALMAPGLRGASLPVTIAAAALGAAVAMAGVIALVVARREPSATR